MHQAVRRVRLADVPADVGLPAQRQRQVVLAIPARENDRHGGIFPQRANDTGRVFSGQIHVEHDSIHEPSVTYQLEQLRTA